jgi:hypothetical protein
MIINENFFDDITDVDVVSDSLPVETSIEQTRTNCLIYAVFLLRNDIIIDSQAESRKDIESKTKSVLDKYEKMLS